MLTRHSLIYDEWKRGLHKDLKPIEEKGDAKKISFTQNGLHFEGEEKSAKYGKYLENALSSWMHGTLLEESVESFFPFKVAHPSVKRDLVKCAIKKYEDAKMESIKKPCNPSATWWLGSMPCIIPAPQKDHFLLSWLYMQTEYRVHMAGGIKHEKALSIKDSLWSLRPSCPPQERDESVLPFLQNSKMWHPLRENGLVEI